MVKERSPKKREVNETKIDETLKSPELPLSLVSTNLSPSLMPNRYTLGIIDILQQYNMRKKAENVYKVTAMGNSKDSVSSVNPEHYAQRFVDFFEQHTA